MFRLLKIIARNLNFVYWEKSYAAVNENLHQLTKHLHRLSAWLVILVAINNYYKKFEPRNNTEYFIIFYNHIVFVYSLYVLSYI